MNKEELELYVKKSCENVFKKLAENPEEMLNLSDLQDKYNNLLKEKIELKEQIKKQKEVIDKVMNLIKKYGKYDGEKCTQGFQMWSADFNKILDILKEVK